MPKNGSKKNVQAPKVKRGEVYEEPILVDDSEPFSSYKSPQSDTFSKVIFKRIALYCVIQNKGKRALRQPLSRGLKEMNNIEFSVLHCLLKERNWYSNRNENDILIEYCKALIAAKILTNYEGKTLECIYTFRTKCEDMYKKYKEDKEQFKKTYEEYDIPYLNEEFNGLKGEMETIIENEKQEDLNEMVDEMIMKEGWGYKLKNCERKNGREELSDVDNKREAKGYKRSNGYSSKPKKARVSKKAKVSESEEEKEEEEEEEEEEESKRPGKKVTLSEIFTKLPSVSHAQSQEESLSNESEDSDLCSSDGIAYYNHPNSFT